MNKMKILVTFVNLWTMDNGNSGVTLNYFMFGEHGEVVTPSYDLSGGAGRSAASKVFSVSG